MSPARRTTDEAAVINGNEAGLNGNEAELNAK